MGEQEIEQDLLETAAKLIGHSYGRTKGCAVSRITCRDVSQDGIDIGDWEIVIKPIRTVTGGSA